MNRTFIILCLICCCFVISFGNKFNTTIFDIIVLYDETNVISCDLCYRHKECKICLDRICSSYMTC